jgi:hypothetical protein
MSPTTPDYTRERPFLGINGRQRNAKTPEKPGFFERANIHSLTL